MCAIRFSVPAHQLYVVDAFLFELLQSSFGLFLQWECKTLESLCTLVQAKLHGDLQDIKVKGKTRKGKAKCQQIRRLQTRALAVGVPIRLRSSWERQRKFKKNVPPATHRWFKTKNKRDIPAQLYPAETQKRKHTQITAFVHQSWLTCFSFTSVTLTCCRSCSASEIGAGEEQDDMCRRYPWKQRSSWAHRQEATWSSWVRQVLIRDKGFNQPPQFQKFHL